MLDYSAGDAERQTPEEGKPGDTREPWEIDRARILHSAAFRRLQRKTQVFAPGEGDFFRTRLTHSIEVAQIAKGIAIRVGANPTVCEAAGLAHDIGHPPFGHAGERVLNERMADAGGFEGNAQNLRVLAVLEIKSDPYLGLNLTRATLDALLKYKRSHSEARARGEDKYFYDEELPLVDWICQGQRDEHTSFECQIMDWADDVAYSVHDVEDAMWAEVITRDQLRGVRPSSAAEEEVVRELSGVLSAGGGERARKAAQKTWSSNTIYELVVAATAEAVEAGGRGARYGCVLRVAPPAVDKSRALKTLAERLLFDDPRVAAVQPRARRIVGGLFDALIARPGLVPALFEGEPSRAACDYIAGMTEDEAEQLFARLGGKSALT